MTTKSPDPTRRRFLAGGALLGAGCLGVRAATAEPAEPAESAPSILGSQRPNAPYPMNDPHNHILSVCLQCNTGCGIRCKLQDGVITKIDGNPYNPWTLLPHLPDETPVDAAAPIDGAICPKGQAGLQTAYDPYRIRRVLKRAGARGENTWVTIPFEQAIEEICEGGDLFADVAGEEGRQVEGLRSLTRFREAAAAQEMASSVAALWAEQDPARKTELISAFRRQHQAHLDDLIDPDHPDLGPRNNQVVLAWGRIKGGRGDLYKRFAASLGTVNAHGHTTVCQGSLYFTCKAISSQYVGGEMSGGKKFYWQADTENSRFVLFVGANLFEANYGPPNRSVRLTANLTSGRTKIAVVDPRHSKLASKAWKWLPIKPGTDGALAMAFTRWMLDNERFDAPFLENANKAAATRGGEASWTNATWLVSIDAEGRPGRLVRAADVIIDEAPLRATERRAGPDGSEYDEKFMVVMVDGVPVAVDPNDTETPVSGDLFVDATLPDGTRVKSGLQLLREAAHERSVADWCEVADLPERDVIAVARELTSYGKQAAVDIHRGVAQHTNGFYNVLGWMTVNMLLGNIDAAGGMSKATTFDYLGKGKGERFDLTAHPGKVPAFGVSSIRHGVDYEKTSLFDGYPARRNWYPLSSDVYEEIIPSIGDAYPYPVKALFMYMGAPTYSLPAGHTNIEVLTDLEKLPLFVSCDILIGPTSLYADYIFPDLSFLERWEFQKSHPCVTAKVQPVRQPAIAPIPELCEVFGQSVPIGFEAMILGVAERLDLPGFGPDGLGSGSDLSHPDDYYLRAVANVAFGERRDGSAGVPASDDRELEIFREARRHLPSAVFDLERWRRIVGDELWPKVVHVLNRGGRFEDHDAAYRGDRLAHPWGALLNIYQEKTAGTIHAGTGEPNPGHAVYLPIRDFAGQEPVTRREGHDLALITHRTISQTKSRTVADPWLSPLMPENGLLLSPSDANRLGLRHGQLVRVVSATNPEGLWELGAGNQKAMEGSVIVTSTVRPGVVSFALGFGHWASGAGDIRIDGHLIEAEPRRQTGIHANAAMWTDSYVTNTCMFDPVGGSVSFYDTHVRLVPVNG